MSFWQVSVVFSPAAVQKVKHIYHTHTQKRMYTNTHACTHTNTNHLYINYVCHYDKYCALLTCYCPKSKTGPQQNWRCPPLRQRGSHVGVDGCCHCWLQMLSLPKTPPSILSVKDTAFNVLYRCFPVKYTTFSAACRCFHRQSPRLQCCIQMPSPSKTPPSVLYANAFDDEYTAFSPLFTGMWSLIETANCGCPRQRCQSTIARLSMHWRIWT